MQEDRKKAEKEKALRERAGAFAGGMKAKVDDKKEEEKPKERVPEAEKTKMDSRISVMVQSEYGVSGRATRTVASTSSRWAFPHHVCYTRRVSMRLDVLPLAIRVNNA